VTPTVILLLAWASLVLAAIPAFLTFANLRLFEPPPRPPADGPRPEVSVLVPARNEAAAISRLIADVLASRDVDLELVILDDSSEDATASLVTAAADRDPRVRLVSGGPLPAGWCGKQHACWQLARAARHDIWVFLDVDVSPSPVEWLLLPLIHFVLLGYLPIARSRQVNSPSLAAGCGQLFVTRRADYERAGGHAAIAASLHDGVKLPRAYRRAGLATDIFDATAIASCRMYATSRDVWRGLSKNATEGIGSPATILPFTILLGGGQVLPVVLAACRLAGRRSGRRAGRGGPRVSAADPRRDPLPAEPHERGFSSGRDHCLPRHPMDRPDAEGPRPQDHLAGPVPRPAVSL